MSDKEKQTRSARSSRSSRKIEPIPVVFADKHAEISYHIMQAVRHLDATMTPEPPVEGLADELTPITFAPQDAERGEAALFYAGDFEDFAEDQHATVFFVRSRTRRILDVLPIPYRVVSSKTEQE